MKNKIIQLKENVVVSIEPELERVVFQHIVNEEYKYGIIIRHDDMDKIVEAMGYVKNK